MIIPLNPDDAEKRMCEEPADQLSPDILFDRHWALAVLEKATTCLREEYRTAKNTSLFEHLKPYLSGEKGTTSYAKAAAQLNAPRSSNLALLGYFSAFHNGMMTHEDMKTTIRTISPERFKEINLQVFDAGYERGMADKGHD